jgi:DNA-binding GntR family transcriptional regulator
LDTILRKLSYSKGEKKGSLPVRERVHESLRSAVLSGRLSPGERLTEEYLADQLGVSRTPVREALHKLESEGLIKPLETRGFVVSRDSKDEVEELFELRSVLEGYALRIICERVSDELLERLNRLIEKAEEALKRGKIDEVFKWNTQFHDSLHGLVTEKRRFHRLLVTMRKYVLMYRKDTLGNPEGAREAVEGHKKIVMALRLKDRELCERVMRDHIQAAKEGALQSLFAKPS